MKNEHDVLARLRQAVHDLEDQVNRTPSQARSAVDQHLLSVLGVEYAIHIVERITGNVKNATRQHEEADKPATVS